MRKPYNTFKATIAILFIICSFSSGSKAQTVIDTIGNTIVEISVAVDTSHFLGGYSSGPWDLYWGPDNKLWYTNANHLCRYNPATVVVDTLLSLPSGFMMGVTADRNFPVIPYVYLCIDSANYYGGGQTIRVVRYEYSLTGDSLFNPLFLLYWKHPGEHSGGRIIYGLDDKLYISTAEYHRASDTLFYNSGKVLRVNPDGTVPSDNPRADYTWSYGHRNPQGIAQTPNGNIFVSEYGGSQDELNLILENRYYGWMIYDGNMCIGNIDSCNYYDTIAVFPIDAAMNPPSGIDYYNHPAIPEFNGLIQAVTGVSKQGIISYNMNATFDTILQKNFYLTQEYGRVRDVCASTDGDVYFIARDRSNADIRVIRNPLFTKMKTVEEEKLFSFYPNPAATEIFFNIKSYDATDIIISDLSGKIVIRKNITARSGSINIEDLPAGCYTISAKSKHFKETNRKLIVVK